MSQNDENMEKTLAELVKQKEETDKTLLSLELLIGISSVILLLFWVMVVSAIEMSDDVVLLITLPIIAYIFVMALALVKIEQIAGYYECANCQHRYVPTYASVVWAPHIGRTRYMKCPDCHQKSWHKKVISKE